MEMATLFVAPDGDLYISFLDEREEHRGQDRRGKPEARPAHGHDAEPPANQMRMVRSGDGGRTWGGSVLVAKPTCVCCGTQVAQGEDGPLFATTRSDWMELKGSNDAVRDPFLSVSDRRGRDVVGPAKIHDDKFKISGCPDVTRRPAVDSTGRLHAAWYTGTESHPGVFYAVSDDDGKTFTAGSTLLADEWVPYGDVKMALDERRPRLGRLRGPAHRRGPDPRGAHRTRTGRASFSKTWAGTAPDIAAGDGFAVVTWGTQGEHDAAGALGLLVARPGS